MLSQRQRLPDRRRQVTREVAWQCMALTVSVGFDAAGTAREIFVAGPKSGADMRDVLEDAAVIISIALQHGVTPGALAKSISAGCPLRIARPRAGRRARWAW